MCVFFAFLLAWRADIALPVLGAGAQEIDAERVRVYRAFVSARDSVTPWRVNIARRTSRLDPIPQKCAEGLVLEPPFDPGEKGRALPKTVIEGAHAKLVRASLGRSVYYLSEVAFDRKHRYAMLNFSYDAGIYGWESGLLVFEKVGGEWRESARRCSIASR
ncbi:MAG TPA: hypothetical protein VES20_03810 [Bryobacteraceae bacterium]|nr:hypothetical protein [Bryobacteraceae bacterium]